MKHDLAVINDVDVDMILIVIPPPQHSEPCYCLTFYQHYYDLPLISTHTRQTSHQSSLSITSHCPSLVGRGNIDWRQALTRPHLNINETVVMVAYDDMTCNNSNNKDHCVLFFNIHSL